MHPIDVAIGLWLCFHAIRGLMRGLIRIIFDLIATVLAVGSAFYFSQPLYSHISHWVSVSSQVGIGISGLLIAASVFLIVSTVGFITNKITNTLGLGLINRVFGALFGLVFGIMWIIPIALFVETFAPMTIKDSAVLRVITPVIDNAWLMKFPRPPGTSFNKESLDSAPHGLPPLPN